MGLEAGGMRFEHVETCTTHNMMRLVEMLLREARDAVGVRKPPNLGPVGYEALLVELLHLRW